MLGASEHATIRMAQFTCLQLRHKVPLLVRGVRDLGSGLFVKYAFLHLSRHLTELTKIKLTGVKSSSYICPLSLKQRLATKAYAHQSKYRTTSVTLQLAQKTTVRGRQSSTTHHHSDKQCRSCTRGLTGPCRKSFLFPKTTSLIRVVVHMRFEFTLRHESSNQTPQERSSGVV